MQSANLFYLHRQPSIYTLMIVQIGKLFSILVLGLMTACSYLPDPAPSPRVRDNFDSNWRFHLGEAAGAEQPSFDDSQWRQLNLPHDWAIEGDFSADNPSGPGGGALPGGIGWYRKHFDIDSALLASDKRIYLDFDGVYMLSEVFVNGYSTGVRPYGYISFRRDITPYLRAGKNVVAVRVDNSEQPNSRWYSGCGIYICPERWDLPYYNETFACSSYDNCHVPWGSTHEKTWHMVKERDFISGLFIWTGFDYLGEPTPYGFPARSSYFGIIDLAGFPKDIYYMYQSEWTDKPVLHLFPHWNHSKGELVDLWCYYGQADEVELWVNGVSQGTRTKEPGCYHVTWRVPFEPGEIRAVSRKDGKEVLSQTIRTAGEPAQIRLTPDRETLHADGRDLSFVTVEILDKEGNLCPLAENDVTFDVTGNAFIAGVDNGSPISMERFKDNHRKAFYGKCLVVLQNNGERGEASLRATSDGLTEARVTITAE